MLACSPEGLKIRKEIMKRHRQKYQYEDADSDPVVENKAVPDAKPSENVPVKEAAVPNTGSRSNVCFRFILVGTVLIGIFVAFMLRNPISYAYAGEDADDATGDGPSTAIKLVEWLKLPVQKLIPSVLQQHIPMLSSSVLELPSSSYDDGDDRKWLELLRK